MKKIQTFSVILLVTFGVVSTSCSETPTDPVAYNNKLMTLLNTNAQDMAALNAAMNTQDYTKAETVRQVWETNLEKSIETASSMDDFDGDDNFRTKVLEGLKEYKNIASKDYIALLELRTTPQKDEVAISEILKKINEKFIEVAQIVNKASSDFIVKHPVS